jgi:Tol biopolymer transport system component/DNA-binding winged helix-turn-helix (wHTH) protein
MSLEAEQIYAFGPYRLDPSARTLTREGEPVVLPPKAFDLLVALVANSGRLLTKRDLMSRLWGDAFVEEGNLSYQMSVLRKALGNESGEWIETAPKHGYRFVQPVDVESRQEPASAVAAADRPVSNLTRKRRLLAIAGLLTVAMFVAVVASWSSRSGVPASGEQWTTTHSTSYPGREGRPSLSPDGSQIAFAWLGPNIDNRDIYIKLADSGDPVRLTTDAAPDVSPEWSPDGRWIAFVRHTGGGAGEVIVIPALGGAERPLGKCCAAADVETVLSWTPDSRWLAVHADCPSTVPQGLDLISVETAERRTLTRAEGGAWHYYPAISPDGRLLAYTEKRTRLKVVPLTGTFATAGPARNIPVGDLGIVGPPTWTTDSRNVVYGKYQASVMTLYRSASDGRSAPNPLNVASTEVMAVNIARQGHRLAYAEYIIDTNVWKVALQALSGNQSKPEPFLVSSRRDEMADYSADGRRVVFMSARGAKSGIWIAGADGSHPYPLVQNHSHVGSPRWSPDGRSVAFDSDLAGYGSVYIVSASGGTPRRLTADSADNRVPSWSADGKSIYFSSDRSGSFQLWKQPVDGGSATQVTRNGGGQGFESPDGQSLFYVKRPGRGLWRMPASGGPETQVAEDGTFLQICAGREGIYFLVNPVDRSSQFGVSMAPYSGGAVRHLVNVTSNHRQGISVSPDGQYLAFTRMDGEEGDIVLIYGYR